MQTRRDLPAARQATLPHPAHRPGRSVASVIEVALASSGGVILAEPFLLSPHDGPVELIWAAGALATFGLLKISGVACALHRRWPTKRRLSWPGRRVFETLWLLGVALPCALGFELFEHEAQGGVATAFIAALPPFMQVGGYVALAAAVTAIAAALRHRD